MADDRERFEQDTGVVLDGGDGNDVLISLGGEGATLIGGAANDNDAHEMMRRAA